MAYMVEYRIKSGFRERWSEWKEHHRSDSEADALEEIKYLQGLDDADREEGLVAWWDNTEYRIAEVMG